MYMVFSVIPPNTELTKSQTGNPLGSEQRVTDTHTHTHTHFAENSCLLLSTGREDSASPEEDRESGGPWPSCSLMAAIPFSDSQFRLSPGYRLDSLYYFFL